MTEVEHVIRCIRHSLLVYLQVLLGRESILSGVSNCAKHILTLFSFAISSWMATLNDGSCISSRRTVSPRRPRNMELSRSRFCPWFVNTGPQEACRAKSLLLLIIFSRIMWFNSTPRPFRLWAYGTARNGFLLSYTWRIIYTTHHILRIDHYQS